MLVTIDIADDVLERAKVLAETHGLALGEALSYYARRGMVSPVGTRLDPLTGLTVFDVPRGLRRITVEDVERALDEADLDEYRKYFPDGKSQGETDNY